MSPCGLSIRAITSSQASAQAVHATHSSWMPLRMSMPVGHTVTHCPQSMQSPFAASCAPRTILPRGTARLATSNLMPAGVFFDGSNGFGAGGRVTLFDTRGKAEVGSSWGGGTADAYGWGEDWARGMGEDDILARLVRLNQDRAATPG